MGDINKEIIMKELFGVDADAKDMQIYSSVLSSLPNPDKVLKGLGLDISVYYDLDIDDQVSAAFQLRKDNVKSMEWELRPSKTRADIFQFVNNVIKKWDMEKIIGEMLDAIAYGYSVMELIWLEDSNGFVYVSSVVGKPPHWFKFDTNNRLRFIGKNYGAEGKLLSKNKFTVVQNYPTYLNPYGNAVFKKCYWPVTFKKGGLKFFAKFVEKYGMIHLLGQIGKNAKDDPTTEPSDTQIDKMVTALDGLFQDGTGAIPGSDDVLVIAGNNQASSEIYKGFIEVCDKQISKAILSHSSAVDSVAGALGNREQIIQSINIIRDSDAKLVIGNMNDIITKMVYMNYGKVDEVEIPMFDLTAKGQTVEMKAQAEVDTMLNGLGVKFTEEYIKKTYSLQDTEFEISSTSNTPPEPTNSFSAKDDIQDEMAEKFQEVVQPIIDQLGKGKSFDEIKKSILEINADLDTTELEALISDVIAVTQVSEED
jgi:phage gp29-like protein